MPGSPPRPSRVEPYRSALAALSARTGAPLHSLAISFMILHELTAILPVVGLFYTARAFGVGERAVDALIGEQGVLDDSRPWAKARVKSWMEEGEVRAERVGRRYGLFGFEKGSRASAEDHGNRNTELSERLAGDVANAVVAYAATKALLPVRIGLSMYLTPSFSRFFVEPIRKNIIRPFQRSGRA